MSLKTDTYTTKDKWLSKLTQFSVNSKITMFYASTNDQMVEILKFQKY